MRNILYALVAAVLVSAICSCRSVKYDSVHVREKGDTVWLEKYRYLFVDKWRTDTLYVNRTDSVQVPYPVERKLTRWQRFRMEVGGFTFFTLVALALVAVGWLVYRARRK